MLLCVPAQFLFIGLLPPSKNQRGWSKYHLGFKSRHVHWLISHCSTEAQLVITEEQLVITAKGQPLPRSRHSESTHNHSSLLLDHKGGAGTCCTDSGQILFLPKLLAQNSIGRWMGGRIDEQKWMDRWMDKLTEGHVGGQTVWSDGWMAGWLDGLTER